MTSSFLQLVTIFEAIAGGLIAAILFSLLAIKIARRARLLDIPGSATHKQHSRPTPLAGGIAMVLSALVLMTVFRLWRMPFSVLLPTAAIVFVFGVWDDAKGLSAPQKLVGHLIASTLLIASGSSIRFLENFSIPFLSPIVITVFNWGLTIFWLVGIANSINLIDSMDGLAVGTAGIAFAFFMAMALVAQQSYLALFSAIFVGICIGLYVFNVSPAWLFLGDSGAQTLGFILAAVAMIYTPNNFPQGSSWFVPILVLGVPIFDTTLVVVSRLLLHRPIFQGDLAHTYHRLVALGLDPNRAVLAIHVTTLILSFLALIALSLSPWKANAVFFTVVFAGAILLIFFVRKLPQPN
ncbi:MAG TPA: MraY family glycosyltransferase [Anaerolineales bacterium]